MKKLQKEFRDLMQTVPPIMAALFILSVVGMNLLANKSINTGVEWLALDCGIFAFMADFPFHGCHDSVLRT